MQQTKDRFMQQQHVTLYEQTDSPTDRRIKGVLGLLQYFKKLKTKFGIYQIIIVFFHFFKYHIFIVPVKITKLLFLCTIIRCFYLKCSTEYILCSDITYIRRKNMDKKEVPKTDSVPRASARLQYEICRPRMLDFRNP